MTAGDTAAPAMRARDSEARDTQVRDSEASDSNAGGRRDGEARDMEAHDTDTHDTDSHDREAGALCPACGQARPPDLPVWVDLPANEIVIEGRRVTVSRHVADTMAALVACKGRVAAHDYLMESVYGLEGGDWPEPNVVSVRMVALRKILNPRGYQVENVWGRGYRLVKLAPEA